MVKENLVAALTGNGEPLKIESVLINLPSAGEILVRNFCIAFQPLDVKILLTGYGGAGSIEKFPFVLGTSAAGVVEDIGEGVNDIVIGDRVIIDTEAYVKGKDKNLREGTWQKFVICDSRTVAKIGEVRFEEAALVEFPLQTAVAALHLFLGMGKPGTGNGEDKVLIWGAGGAVGSYAVQYAKSVGHRVIVTASPRDLERQKRLGASELVDYRAADSIDQLKTLGLYKYLLTASGDATSQKVLATLLQPSGGKFASVLGGEIELPDNVERIYEQFSQAAQQDEFGGFRQWWYREYLPKVLQEGLIEAVVPTKKEGGLAVLPQVSKDVFEGKVKGEVVINPQE